MFHPFQLLWYRPPDRIDCIVCVFVNDLQNAFLTLQAAEKAPLPLLHLLCTVIVAS